MAQINWSLLQSDPAAAQQRGYSYADQVAKAAGQQQAGQKWAAGDFRGAVTDLANSGDLDGAIKLQGAVQQQADAQSARTKAVYSYLGQALPIFQQIAKVHAGDPDGGSAAIGKAFDAIAPEISDLTGHNEQALASLRQNLIADPAGTLQRIQAMLPSDTKVVGRDLVRTQGDTVTPLYHGQNQPPAGYELGPDGKTLVFIPGGPADPKTVGSLANEKRMVIVNNPVPQQGGGKAPAGYRWTADGQLEAIPGGPADKLNNEQSLAVGFGNRMSAAADIIDHNEKAGTDAGQHLKAEVPLIGNYLVSNDYQNLDQASRDFINAQLRRESGAAISESEFVSARKQYLPQPGDAPAVLAQKRAARRRAVENMRISAGRGGSNIPAAPAAGGQTNVDDLLQKYGH